MTEQARPALLAFSIGPVQEYISAARRSQDLYVGSVLLSQLTNAACSKAGWEHVLYPAQPPSAQPVEAPLPLPNRFIARYDSVDVAVEKAKQAEAAVRAHWAGVATQVRADIARRLASPPPDWAAAWEDQVNNYLDITWAVVPVPMGGAYDLTSAWATLEARRRLHAFAPIQMQHGYKCTIFSGLSAMGPGHTKTDQPYQALREFWQGLAATVSTGASAIVLRPDGRERLSALACVKRFAPFIGDPRLKRDVPSTSSIAAAPYKAALLQQLAKGDERLDELLVAYLDTLLLIRDQDEQGKDRRPIRHLAGDDRATPYLYARAQRVAGKERCKKLILRYDGDLFFAETLTANRLYGDYGLEVIDGPTSDPGRAGWRDIHDALQKARAALKALVQYTTKLEPPIAPPACYYAVLMMDGDHMGDLFHGITDRTLHQTVSSTLSEFASKTVWSIVEEQHPGKLIYAGGDDALALLPLADALLVARQLQEAYHAAMAELVPDAPSPTASVGLAIAHHQAALDHVLAEARLAEKAAKQHYQRNALAVHALKRSGAPLRVGLHYPKPSQSAALDPLAAVQLLIEAAVLSPRFAYAFAREAHAYADGPNLQPMLQATLYRLLGRQGEPNGLFTFGEKQKERAEQLCQLLGLEAYTTVQEQLIRQPEEEQKQRLVEWLYKPLAKQLASLATGLQASTLYAVEQAERTRRNWPECPPPKSETQRAEAAPPSPTATGAPALADWLLLIAFLTRGGTE